MAEHIIPSKWINLPLPFDCTDAIINVYEFHCPKNITIINAHEFILSTYNKLRFTSKLFKYNIDTNTFNELSIDGNKTNTWYSGIMDFNNKEQILYIKNG
eukprot:387106_1